MRTTEATTALDLVRSLYAAYAARDITAIFAILSPGIRITQTALLPWGGVFEGTAGAQRFMELLRTHVDSVATIERIFEAGEQVVVTGRTAGRTRASGTPFDVAIVHVLTVRDGKVVAAEYHIDTPAMLTALGTPPEAAGA